MNQDEAERQRRAAIEHRAYQLFQERGGHHGFDREDWEQAEREIDGVPAALDDRVNLEDEDDRRDEPA